ncbi:putative protein MULTIPOLAR SPINDLE 1 [Helianthus annuus]|nr:putative protein MULTIPOLAR SPINDLE 1 [Helianthus annuus]KAJ0625492.1 putative protein MULTIPOLAR SPINDLE 1 [Helianthus annuus]KAJ0781889.1 putative protein MULTIPOLAR SPINDLE 1 [Helianthus annuus]
MQTTTTAGSDEPLKLALAMALLRSKLVNKTSETSHPPSDTSSSAALKWKRKEKCMGWAMVVTRVCIAKERSLDPKTSCVFFD